MNLKQSKIEKSYPGQKNPQDLEKKKQRNSSSKKQFFPLSNHIPG